MFNSIDITGYPDECCDHSIKNYERCYGEREYDSGTESQRGTSDTVVRETALGRFCLGRLDWTKETNHRNNGKEG